MNTATKILKLRLKDKRGKVLCQMAREVNQVFNFCNEISARAIRERHQWLSGYDLQKLTAGFSQCDGVTIGSGTVQVVCAEYVTRCRQFKKSRLNWRVSNLKSNKYSLGWIPFKGGHATQTCSCRWVARGLARLAEGTQPETKRLADEARIPFLQEEE